MAKSKSYKEYLIDSLKDQDAAAGYLNAALEDNDPEVFLLALRDVAQANEDGMTRLAKRAKLNRESMYKMLSATGNPELHSLSVLLGVLGMQLAVKVKKAS